MIKWVKKYDTHSRLTKKIVDRIEKAADMAGLIPDSLENELSSFGRFFSEIINKKERVLILLSILAFQALPSI